MTNHITDEQIDATSADELLLKVYELLWGEHPECCGNPEAVGYFGDSPAIDCCRCPNYARLNDAQIVASLRALIKESDLMSLLGMRSAKTTPLADWSVDVFDDDEEGRTYINIRNPDDDVAAAGVNTYVVGNRRTLASQVLRGFHQAFRAALTAAPTPPAQPAVPEDVAREPMTQRWCWWIGDAETFHIADTESEAHGEARCSIDDDCEPGDTREYSVGRVQHPIDALGVGWLAEHVAETIAENTREWCDDNTGAEDQSITLAAEDRKVLGTMVAAFLREKAAVHWWTADQKTITTHTYVAGSSDDAVADRKAGGAA